jgi:hypothetical protein
MQTKYFTVASISENIEKTPEGFLICKDVPIMRSGELEYKESETPNVTPDGSGVTVVNRSRSVLTNGMTLRSFEGKPVTLGHPEQDDFVTPENYKSLVVGTLQNVRTGQGDMTDYIISDMLINDSAAINKVLSGEIREVSVGGVGNFKEVSPGVGEQDSLLGNHVALVKEGRAGSACAIRDSKEGIMSIKDKFMAIFTAAATESCKVLDEAMPKDAEEAQKETQTESVAELKGTVAKLQEGNDALMKSFAEIKELLVAKKEDAASNESTSNQEAKVDELDLDTISRAEILSPGIAKVGDVKTAALTAFYATRDGKTVIEPLLMGGAINDANKDMLFIAASEMVKANRSALSFRDANTVGNPHAGSKSVQTIEQINKANETFWKGK